MDTLFYLKLFLHHTITLLTIINPIAAASVMITLIDANDKSTVKYVAKRTTLVVLIASVTTFLMGEYIFRFFGINVLSIQVIGGIILILISINMIYGQPLKAKSTPEEKDEAKEKEDIAIVPLGIPILFGPATIALLIVLKEPKYSVYEYITTLISIVATSFIVYLSLLNASAINRILGVTGIKIFIRIMGLILGAIASQLLIAGIKGLWFG